MKKRKSSSGTSHPASSSGGSPLTSPQHKVGVVITSSRQAHRRYVYKYIFLRMTF